MSLRSLPLQRTLKKQTSQTQSVRPSARQLRLLERAGLCPKRFLFPLIWLTGVTRRFPPRWSIAIIRQALAADAPHAFRRRYSFAIAVRAPRTARSAGM